MDQLEYRGDQMRGIEKKKQNGKKEDIKSWEKNEMRRAVQANSVATDAIQEAGKSVIESGGRTGRKINAN